MSDRQFPSEDDLVEALNTLSLNAGRIACPICMNQTWEIETEPTGGLLSILPLPGIIGFKPSKSTTMSPLIPCLVLVCENCGFIREHSVPMLLRKSRSKRV